MVINVHDIDIEVRAAVLNSAADEIMHTVDVGDVDGETVATLFAVNIMRDFAFTMLARDNDRLRRELATAEQTARTQIASEHVAVTGAHGKTVSNSQPMIGAHRPD